MISFVFVLQRHDGHKDYGFFDYFCKCHRNWCVTVHEVVDYILQYFHQTLLVEQNTKWQRNGDRGRRIGNYAVLNEALAMQSYGKLHFEIVCVAFDFLSLERK